MYRVINKRMTDEEAMKSFPDSFIVMRRDSKDMSVPEGVVLYEGNDELTLGKLMLEREDCSYCICMDGDNLQNYIGGIVVNG